MTIDDYGVLVRSHTQRLKHQIGSQGPRSSARFIPALVAALCLPLPLVFGWGLMSRALSPISKSLSDLFAVVFFFSYLIVLPPALYLIEPFAAVVTIVYTLRDNRGAGPPRGCLRAGPR